MIKEEEGITLNGRLAYLPLCMILVRGFLSILLVWAKDVSRLLELRPGDVTRFDQWAIKKHGIAET